MCVGRAFTTSITEFYIWDFKRTYMVTVTYDTGVVLPLKVIEIVCDIILHVGIDQSHFRGFRVTELIRKRGPGRDSRRGTK